MHKTWIVSPAWDLFWLLSGLPLAIVFLISSPWVSPAQITFWFIVVLAQAHFISPIVLTWIDQDLRRRALAAPLWYIWLPLSLVAVCAAIGWFAPALPTRDLNFSSILVYPGMWRNPLVMLLVVYILWNAYHFGKQNFGVLSLYRVKNRQGHRAWDNAFCLAMLACITALPFTPYILPPAYGAGIVKIAAVLITSVGLAIMLWSERNPQRSIFIGTCAGALLLMAWWPYLLTRLHFSGVPMASELPWWPGLWAFALLSMNHWLVAIGLSARIFSGRSGRSPWLLIILLLAAGAMVFCVLFVNLRTFAIHVTKLAVALRLSVGFVHFLYDRWLYRPIAQVAPDIFGTRPRLVVQPLPAIPAE